MMFRLRRMILPMILALAAIVAAAAATLGTLWCARPDRPARTAVFIGVMIAALAAQRLLFTDGWLWLMIPEMMYLLLFLAAKRFRRSFG